MARLGVLLALALGILLGGVGDRLLTAQPSGLTRTLLLRTELAGVENREVFMGTAELAPGAAAGRHYHHGLEIGYVLEGTAVLEVDGKPPVSLKPGDSYEIPATVPHDAKNTGSAPAKVLAVYVVEKGKPLAVPAP